MIQTQVSLKDNSDNTKHILAHFDNIPMLFNSAFNGHGVQPGEVREWMRNASEKDYQDLSENTKYAQSPEAACPGKAWEQKRMIRRINRFVALSLHHGTRFSLRR